MAPKSMRIGLSVAAFPDVCKTSAPGGPIPIPYPNGRSSRAGAKPSPAGSRAAGSAGAAGSSAAAAQSLRATMQTLHSQLASMPGNDPNRWHELLDRYVQTTAELYKELALD